MGVHEEQILKKAVVVSEESQEIILTELCKGFGIRMLERDEKKYPTYFMFMRLDGKILAIENEELTGSLKNGKGTGIQNLGLELISIDAK